MTPFATETRASAISRTSYNPRRCTTGPSYTCTSLSHASHTPNSERWRGTGGTNRWNCPSGPWHRNR
ncbi:MAG TPA: hypothetical protein ENH00_02050 [Actinobacteria bacterium]|nr:hypothetical protein [Actinomycetota bacterium]